LCVGLFAREGGLFTTGQWGRTAVQFVGVGSVIVFVGICMIIVFQGIKHTIGLRVSKEEEILGLDSTEHGLASAYADFVPVVPTVLGENTKADLIKPMVPVTKSVPVEVISEEKESIASDVKLSKITIICKQNKFDDLQEALNAIGVMGITVTQVLGCGTQKGAAEYYRGVPVDFNLLPKCKVDVIVSKVPVTQVIKAAKDALYTGHIGDGKIFVYDVENVVKVRTGEEGFDALQDDK
jgi:Amt family ammonium transporter